MKMKSESDYQYLLNASFRFLSFRPRSRKEIHDFLKKKIYGPELIEKTIERLRELGHVDDTKFVQWWVEQRQGRKPKGMQLIVYELMSKGVARDIIEQVLSSDLGDQKELAKKAISKKIDTLKNVSVLEKKKKLGDFLFRRGFSGDVIRRVVDDTVEKRYNKTK